MDAATLGGVAEEVATRAGKAIAVLRSLDGARSLESFGWKRDRSQQIACKMSYEGAASASSGMTLHKAGVRIRIVLPAKLHPTKTP